MENPETPDKSPYPTESAPHDQHKFQHGPYEVDAYKLIYLTREIPGVEISVGDFLDHLEGCCWTDQSHKDISPKDIIDAYRAAGGDREKLAVMHPELLEHIKKIDAANLSFPVIIFEGRIVDGMHRFVKAVLEGQVKILAKVLTQLPSEAIIKVHGSTKDPV